MPGRLCWPVAELARQLPCFQHCQGGGGPGVSSATSAHPQSHHIQDQEQPPGSTAGSRHPANQGCHRESARVISGVLQLAVFCPEKDRRSVSRYRSIYSEPPLGRDALVDGDKIIHQSRHQGSGVDCVNRHQACLSPISDASGCEEIPVFCGQPEDLPVHLSSLQVGNITPRVHKAVDGSCCFVAVAQSKASCLL